MLLFELGKPKIFLWPGIRIYPVVLPGKNHFQENAEKRDFPCDIFGLRRYVIYVRRMF